MKLRKLLAILMVLAMVLAMAMFAVGCGEDNSTNDDDDEDEDERTTTSTTLGGEEDPDVEDPDVEDPDVEDPDVDAPVADSSELAEYIEENYDEMIDVLSNGAPDDVDVSLEVEDDTLVVTFVWAMLDDLSDEELDEMGAEDLASDWAPAFQAIKEEITSLEAIELVFCTSDGDTAFTVTVDENTEYVEDPDMEVPDAEDPDVEDPDVEDPDVSTPAGSDEEAILGEWVAEINLSDYEVEGMIYYYFTFEEDGTMSMAMEMDGETDTLDGEYSVADGQITMVTDITEVYDYTVDGDEMILDYVSGADEETEELAAMFFPMTLTRVD